MRIVVIEGPDLAGKSSLARAIESKCREHGLVTEHVHNGPPRPGERVIDTYLDQIRKAGRSANDRVVVFDRLHVGEVIYGPLYRNQSQLGTRQLIRIESELDSLDARRILVDVPDEILVERFEGERGEDFVRSQSHLLQIAAEYRRLVGSAPLTNWDIVRGDQIPNLSWVSNKRWIAAGQ